MDHDLHSLLAAARDAAPPPRLSIDDITAAGRQLVRRRRRTALLSSLACGVAAVITGAAAAVMLLSPPTAAPTADPDGNPGLADVSQSPARRADFAPAAGFETNYSGYTSGRYVVRAPDLVTADYQQSTIALSTEPPAESPSASPTGAPSFSGLPPAGALTSPAQSASPAGGDFVPREGRLVVYGTGAFDPREFVGGEKLMVGGKTALLRYAGSPSIPSSSTIGKGDCCMTPTVPTIAWQYMTNAWAAIYWSSFEAAPTRDELVALADGLPADDPRPFPVGIRLKEALKGYRLIAVSTRTSSSDETSRSVVRLALKPPAVPLTGPVDFDRYTSIVLTLGVADPMTGKAISKTACLPGRTTCTALIDDGQFYLQVESVGDRPVDASVLSQLLKAMSAEQPDDRTSWPPATSVFTF